MKNDYIQAPNDPIDLINVLASLQTSGEATGRMKNPNPVQTKEEYKILLDQTEF